ncbi:MAG: VIT and vWA domain-containing protein [Planctomycetota bacterium]|jgi:Ca-activated chloride channel family protein
MKPALATRLGVWLVIALWATAVEAQGLLLVTDSPDRAPLPRPTVRPRPQPPVAYKIKNLGVQARVTDQAARVQVSQSFVNTGSRQMEVSFVFPLPYDGAIDRLTFLVDGKEYPAQLLPADEARRIYESHIRRNRDPALLEWLGTGMFKTSVFPVPAGAERVVTLRYSQLLRKDHELTDFLFPLSTAKYTSAPVEKVEIHVSIESSIPIKTVYSPTHQIQLKRPDGSHAVVDYVLENQVPASDFRLFYGVAKGKLGASVISYRPDDKEDGYLLLLASPQIKPPEAKRPKKTVVCVFDRSGSMSGEKIEQAREALRFVLNNLRKGDLFNVVAYDTHVEAFRPELERYDDDTRKQALGFVEGMYAGGGTNIDEALATALGMLRDSSQPSFIIFMTDGRPTVGETNESKIVEASQGNNKVRARLVSFGVGYDVNSRLLDRLSRANFGRTEFVRPNEDIEEHVGRLYHKISSPVMTGVDVSFDFDEIRVEQGPPVNRLYPRDVADLFEGEQLVLVGRYKKSGLAKITITGSVGGQEQEFDFPATLADKSNDHSYAFVEKLWAMRRIGEILDQLDLYGRNEELIKELVALSTKHGILTPYTSFLADEDAAPAELASTSEFGARRADELLGRLGETAGKAAFAQRDLKKELREALLADSSELKLMIDGRAAGTEVLDIDADRLIAVRGVKTVAGKTFYRRGNVWFAFDAAEKGLKRIKVVERFSPEYFRLIRLSSGANKAVLAAQAEGEELMLEAPAADAEADVYHIK